MRYMRLKSVLTAVSFKTVHELIGFVSDTFRTWEPKHDIVFVHKDVTTPQGIAKLYVNGRLEDDNVRIEECNRIYTGLIKRQFTSGVYCYIDQQSLEMIDETYEMLKVLFLYAENFDQAAARAGTDMLTKLHNRHAFDVFISETFPELQRNGQSMCMLFMDMDHFKRINDIYGHQVGDTALQRVAGVISKNVKGRDFAFRYGGDEMGVIVMADVDGAVKCAQRISSGVRQVIIDELGDARISISIGVAETSPTAVGTEMITRADSALMQTKNRQRGSIGVWSPTLRTCDIQEKKDVATQQADQTA